MAKKIFCVANQKGGVGKTTTAQSLAAQLNNLKYSVLAIDLDSQCNLTSCLVGDDIEIEKSSYDILVNKKQDITECILPLENGISLVPASLALAKADVMLVSEYAREKRLKNALKPILDDYDFIVIDTPPTLGTITVNALVASTDLIIPCKADKFSKDGITDLFNTVEDIQSECNPNLNVAGILLVCTNKQTVLYKKFKADLEELAELNNTKVFNSYISECMSVKKAQAEKKDVIAYRAFCSASIDYKNFVKEVLKDA